MLKIFLSLKVQARIHPNIYSFENLCKAVFLCYFPFSEVIEFMILEDVPIDQTGGWFPINFLAGSTTKIIVL